MTVFDTLKFLKYPYLMKSPSYFVVRLEQENHAISKTSSSMTQTQQTFLRFSQVSRPKRRLCKLRILLMEKWTEKEKGITVPNRANAFCSWMTLTCLRNKNMAPSLQFNCSGNIWTKEDGMNIRIKKSPLEILSIQF